MKNRICFQIVITTFLIFVFSGVVHHDVLGQHTGCYTVDVLDCSVTHSNPEGGDWDPPCTDSMNICTVTQFGLPTCSENWVAYRPNGTYGDWRDALPNENGSTHGQGAQMYCVIRDQCDCKEEYIGEPCKFHSTMNYPGSEVVNSWLTGAPCVGGIVGG